MVRGVSRGMQRSKPKITSFNDVSIAQRPVRLESRVLAPIVRHLREAQEFSTRCRFQRTCSRRVVEVGMSTEYPLQTAVHGLEQGRQMRRAFRSGIYQRELIA